MSLTETKVIDQITVTENGIVIYREITRIMRGDEQIAQTYHRTSLVPAQDITNQPEKVVAICNLVWTPEVITAYEQAVLAASLEAENTTN